MTLYPSDLAYCTPDADGIVRLHRGTTKQIEIRHPSFVGDVRLYRGLAADVGQGELAGWEIITEIQSDTFLRVATTDAEVGQTSGTNEYTITVPTIDIPDKTPTGTVDLDHDHGGNTSDSSAGTTEQTTDLRSVTDDGGIQTDVADDTHVHQTPQHNHGINPDGDSTKPLTIEPITFDPINLDPIELEVTPKAISFYLIVFTGVIAEATTT